MEYEEDYENNDEKFPVIVIGKDNFFKFLVQGTLSMNQFIFVFRQKIKLESKHAIYIEIEGRKFISFNSIIADLHRLYKYNDGYLYIRYTTEEYMG